ncbi:MAG TPA: lamin tail domain-containing protein [Burkholderiales bacterium]
MKKLLLGFTALAAVCTLPAQAQVRVTEVAPWSSGDSPVAADWFELTNTGNAAVNISGWTMDDNSNSFSKSVALNGVSSIAAGQSVVFIEDTGDGDADLKSLFLSTWFNGAAPANVQIGFYGGNGVGLSTSGDAVNVFNAAGALQANVSFGASSTGFTFDNAAGLNNATIAALSQVGVNGAFAAPGDSSEIGSPGLIAAVPEPSTYALMLGGLVMLGAIARKRKQA